jgi:hypothetical protein
MDNYHECLSHMAEPSAPSEREDAVFVQYTDYDALYLAEVLDEYGHWEASGLDAAIAKGYAEYLRDRVRNTSGRSSRVRVYFHSEKSVEVFLDAIDHFPTTNRADIRVDVLDALMDYAITRILDQGMSVRFSGQTFVSGDE